jgi:acetate kinase
MVLVINAGSSSLKYQLIDMENDKVLAKGLCERIGIDGRVVHKTDTKDYEERIAMGSHADAIRIVIKMLTDGEYGVIPGMESIKAVGHRAVHGGHFTDAKLITDAIIAQLEAMIPLAPLHMPPNLTGIRACAEVMPGVPQVAVYDTAFHQTMPEKAYLYPLPYEYYTQHKIRRYGFHGTSHRYVTERAAAFLGKPAEALKLITCHLGNGSSLAAIQYGESVDTTMGFTPLEGVPMGTRTGSIDPAIVQFLCDAEGLTPKEVIDIMNKKSGMHGLSGGYSDFRDLYAQADGGNEGAQRAAAVFAYCVSKFIGAYAVAMGGVDALIFTAGIGENHRRVRRDVCTNLGVIGLRLDAAKNETLSGEVCISTDDSPGKILIIPTNEELMIARDTVRILAGG